jgi:hypothetical protein
MWIHHAELAFVRHVVNGKWSSVVSHHRDLPSILDPCNGPIIVRTPTLHILSAMILLSYPVSPKPIQQQLTKFVNCRYSYFTFDEESRSFICPLCKDCCNCSNCTRKRNLAHLLGPKYKGLKSSFTALTKSEGLEGMTVQSWLEKAVEERVGVPFDRVRLVNQAEDIITPVVVEEEEVIVAAPKSVTKKRKAKSEGPKQKKAKKIKGYDGKSLVVRLKIPKMGDMPPTEPVKEVDSDGDTIGGWSDSEERRGRRNSTLTPLSDASVPLGGAYQGRPSVLENDYLASLVNPTLSAPISPNVTQQSDYPYDPTLTLSSFFPSTQPHHVTPSPPDHVPATVRRRKPPPKANILRAPRYSLTPPEEAVRTLPDPAPLNYWPTPSDLLQPIFGNPPRSDQQHLEPSAPRYESPFPYNSQSYGSSFPSYTEQANTERASDLTAYSRGGHSDNVYSHDPPPYSHSPNKLHSQQALPQTHHVHFEPAQYPEMARPGHLDLLSIAATKATQK